MTKKTEAQKKQEQASVDTEAKRKLLVEKYKTRVNVAIFKASGEDEPCIVYFKAANTFTKMQCMDMAMQSPMKASRTLFEATVIKEESDLRVFQQDNDEDFYYLGAIKYCGELVTYAKNTLKKVAEYFEIFHESETLKRAALIRFYFHLDTTKLSQERIQQLWIELCYCLNPER